MIHAVAYERSPDASFTSCTVGHICQKTEINNFMSKYTKINFIGKEIELSNH